MSGATIPKPPKRGPKPRKPIKRSSKPIARKSRPAPVRRSESGRAKSAADREWSRAVRAKGPCAALGRWGHIACFGRIDPAHIQSRRYLATRHDVSNGLPLCRFIHDWFGRHPEEFEAFVRSRIGDAEYERLRLKAIQGPKLHQTPSRPSIQPSQLDEARAGIEGRGSVIHLWKALCYFIACSYGLIAIFSRDKDVVAEAGTKMLLWLILAEVSK